MLIQSVLFDRETSSRTAVVCAERDLAFSYAEITLMSKDLAAGLQRAGLQKGDRVAILLPNSVEFVLAFFGSMTAGAVVVPTDIYLKKDDLLTILSTIKPRFLVTNHNLLRKIRSDLGSTTACLLEYGDGLSVTFTGGGEIKTGGEACIDEDAAALEPRFPQRDADEDALLIMSSGTTGLPKAVRLSHRAVLCNIRMHLESLNLGVDLRGLQVLPMNFSYGLIACFLSILYSGGTVVLLPYLDPGLVCGAVGRFDVNLFMGTPTIFQYLIEKSGSALSAGPLRYITIGGDRCKRYALELMRSGLPSARIYITYGLSEAGPRVSTLPHELVAELPHSVGLPLKGVEISVLDGENRLCAPHAAGEIVLRTPSLMNGYFGDDERTRSVIRDGLCHTGDIGYLDERGFLYYVGRKDRQFKFGGRNVNPSFIEQCLSSHPHVQEVSVVKIDGERDESICAKIKARNVCEDELLGELKRLCRKHMPSYMVPGEFIFEDHDHYYYKGKIFNPRKEHLPEFACEGKGMEN